MNLAWDDKNWQRFQGIENNFWKIKKIWKDLKNFERISKNLKWFENFENICKYLKIFFKRIETKRIENSWKSWLAVMDLNLFQSCFYFNQWVLELEFRIRCISKLTLTRLRWMTKPAALAGSVNKNEHWKIGFRTKKKLFMDSFWIIIVHWKVMT